MKRYVVDIETTSLCDLPKCGAWVYAENPSTRILCVAWCDADSYDEPESWDVLTGTRDEWTKIREELLSADLLIAHNANFERHCLGFIDDARFHEAPLWADSAMLCGAAGRPRALKDACKSLLFPENLSKDKRGVRLLNMFSVKTPKGHIYAPADKPKEFTELVEYCRQDVVAERALWQALAPVWNNDPTIAKQWELDCAVEDFGVPIDTKEVKGALSLYNILQEDATRRCFKLTDGISMRSTPALREWTAKNGWALDSFSASAVDNALSNEKSCAAAPLVAEFLRLRKATSGTAGKKFEAIEAMTSTRGGVNACHGVLVGRGAHTGRYAGRGLQPQNLPRGKVAPEQIPFIRSLAQSAVAPRNRMLNVLTSRFGDQSNDALASILRDTIAAPEGKVFIVSDYSAIEARVLAWLAGEEWVEAIFAGDGKIYERTAAAMYGKNLDDVTKHERMAGKIATLALGYGGGVSALNAMASAYGVQFDAKQGEDIVAKWRYARQATVRLWQRFANFTSLDRPGGALSLNHCILWKQYTQMAGRRVMRLILPSERSIYYWNPLECPGGFKAEMYGSTGGYCDDAPEASGAHYARMHGGKICENIVQAIAFDLLLNSLTKLHEEGFDISFHVHDEIIVVADKENAEKAAARMKEIMTTVPKWAKGLVLATEPEIMERYKK